MTDFFLKDSKLGKENNNHNMSCLKAGRETMKTVIRKRKVRD